MKKIHKLLFLFFFSFLLVSNSAQPGIWNAGGSGTFTLLYPEDSLAYKKIQMQSENIFIQLHKGFGVVKGEYHFKNTTKDSLKIKVGYPVNNVFNSISNHGELNEVRVDGLYKIKGIVNNKELQFYETPNQENDNWYVWKINFPPEKITTFTVYFLVNTNNANVLQGYNSDDRNAFIYLIETGSLWKSPIEKGNFYVELKDNISINDIKIAAPVEVSLHQNILHFSMEDYGKTPDKNFVATYGSKNENFNFTEITLKSEDYFSSINDFSKRDFNTLKFIKTEFENPYEVFGIGGYLVSSIYFLFIYGIPILGLIALFFIIKAIIRKAKK